MKVLVFVREDALIRQGGDFLSISDKEKKLNDLGIFLTFSSNPKTSLIDFDLIHIHQSISNIFNIFSIYKNIRKHRKPFSIKPFYNPIIDIDNYRKNTDDFKIRLLSKIFNYYNYIKYKNLYNLLKKLRLITFFKSFYLSPKYLTKIILKKSYCITDSKFELQKLSSELNVDFNHSKVVNASLNLTDDLKKVSKNIFYDKFKLDNFVLCVGRIEPLKNQNRLLMSLIKANLKVLVIGKLQKLHKNYGISFKKLIKENRNFYWIEDMDRKTLCSAFKNAKVLTIPSWTETAGMTALEGAYFGCNLALTNRGACKEYFQNNALYMNPNSIKSIRECIINSYNLPKNAKKLRNYVQEKFSLNKTAIELSKAFNDTLNNTN